MLEGSSEEELCAEGKGRKVKLSRLERADGCVLIHPKKNQKLNKI